MKTLFFFLVLATSLSLNAQITKGNWLVGGNFRFYSENSENTSNDFTTTQKGFGFNLSSNLGYFLKDRLAIGLVPTFGYGNPEGSGNSGYGFEIGPFARYYFLETDKRINIFSHLEYQFGNGYSNGDKVTENRNFNIKAGPSIFFNSSVAIEITLEYAYGKVTSLSGIGSESKINNFNIGIGFQIHLEK
ncbi:outer membrane beta-barrel protein [Gelidibacter salicanalis]|uniref:Outer membrane beta-barrel protein n=1 Tax=Gelidibacter salicanalis TaxID=291193 RepID=A0A934NKY6_9FLAO|nr:outer membrane beta-barrel protein [Gelidibacter salicanalis]MBJ7883037.1 outer membrane beta-barrel protein [Gelidibacter salicanalis]